MLIRNCHSITFYIHCCLLSLQKFLPNKSLRYKQNFKKRPTLFQRLLWVITDIRPISSKGGGVGGGARYKDQSCHPNQAPNLPGRVPNNVDVDLQQNNTALKFFVINNKTVKKSSVSFLSISFLWLGHLYYL